MKTLRDILAMEGETMGNVLRKRDVERLRDLAEYRILTSSQVMVLYFGSKPTALRWIRGIRDKGFLETASAGFRKKRGRSEKMISLSRKGIDLLKKEGVVPESVTHRQVNGDEFARSSEHQLLLNWFRLHLNEVPRVLPGLAVNFLSSKSPFSLRSKNTVPLVYEPPLDSFEKNGRGSFTPDGVFSITNVEQKISLLFFLEIDMNTESLGSEYSRCNISTKIRNYQEYFLSGKYKRYEKVWQQTFQGFRTLFLTVSHRRMTKISELVRSTGSSDFIWVANREQMFSMGLADAIWARGGREDIPQESILNKTLCCPSPVISDLL